MEDNLYPGDGWVLWIEEILDTLFITALGDMLAAYTAIMESPV